MKRLQYVLLCIVAAFSGVSATAQEGYPLDGTWRGEYRRRRSHELGWFCNQWSQQSRPQHHQFHERFIESGKLDSPFRGCDRRWPADCRGWRAGKHRLV